MPTDSSTSPPKAVEILVPVAAPAVTWTDSNGDPTRLTKKIYGSSAIEF